MVKDEFGDIEKSKSEEAEVENKSGVKCVNDSGIAVEVVDVHEVMIVDEFGTVKEKYVVKTDEMEDDVGRYKEEKIEDKPGEPSVGEVEIFAEQTGKVKSIDTHEEMTVEKKRVADDAVVGTEMEMKENPEKEALKYEVMNVGVEKVCRDYAAKFIEGKKVVEVNKSKAIAKQGKKVETKKESEMMCADGSKLIVAEWAEVSRACLQSFLPCAGPRCHPSRPFSRRAFPWRSRTHPRS